MLACFHRPARADGRLRMRALFQPYSTIEAMIDIVVPHIPNNQAEQPEQQSVNRPSTGYSMRTQLFEAKLIYIP